MCNRWNAPPQPFNKDNVVNGKIVWGTLEFIPKSIATTLWEGSVGQWNARTENLSVNLNSQLDNYDVLGFYIVYYPSGTDRTVKRRQYFEHRAELFVDMNTSSSAVDHVVNTWGWGDAQNFIDFLPSTSTQLKFNINMGVLLKVMGIKYPQNRK